MKTFIKNTEINLVLPKKLKSLIEKNDKTKAEISKHEFTKRETEILIKLGAHQEQQKSCDESIPDCDENTEKEMKVPSKSAIVLLSQLKEICVKLENQRRAGKNEQFLHEILQDSLLILPQNEIQERNPELEARCLKLKAELAKKEYQNMTKNVDNSRKRLPEDTIAYQSKICNILFFF